VLLVDGVLLTGPLHPNLDCHVGLIDLIVVAEGLKAPRNYLHPHRRTHGQDIDNRLAIFVGLQLHVAFVFLSLHGMKDHGSIFDGFAIHILQDGHLDARGWDRHLELAAARAAVIALAMRGERRDDQAEACQEDGETEDGVAYHLLIVDVWRVRWESRAAAKPYWTMYITEVLDMVSVLAGIHGTRNGNA
jgi:hypothetical protein